MLVGHVKTTKELREAAVFSLPTNLRGSLAKGNGREKQIQPWGKKKSDPVEMKNGPKETGEVVCLDLNHS